MATLLGALERGTLHLSPVPDLLLFSWLCNDFAGTSAGTSAMDRWPAVHTSLMRVITTIQTHLPAARVAFLVGGERALFPYSDLCADYDEVVGLACELLTHYNIVFFRGVDWMRRMAWKDSVGHMAVASVPLCMDMWEAHIPYARPPIP